MADFVHMLAPTVILLVNFIVVGSCFQNESHLLENVTSLKTHLKITVQKDLQLQVPFPTLNKALPSASSRSSANVGADLQSSKTETPPVSLIADGSQQMADSLVNLSEDKDWRHTAEEFLEVLAEAVQVG